MGEDEFAEVYAATYKPLLGYALRRCDSPEDAADVVAETFAIAWRRAAEMPAGGEARLWLYGVARRVLANQRRGARRHGLRTAALVAELSVSAPTRDDSAVAEVFRRLPDRDRELLALVAWEGLSHTEIATVLGCSANAVSVRLHRARGRFARALRSAGVVRPQVAVQARPVLQESDLT
ncbi:sigma-70 family RNA polymerase sigma factor [Actinomadura logoneensis]|uniref:Sigma-70 family RNA polymerase sigma factor n=1 Tax=Actinomadura logoneensis TaxID=2293572 RepID=A0A372JCB3_9ACTN|nr:sigma-70 family RNA polymerase sigma factor [Actinomadura logoneensis]RFU37474.1 sigma-70 family RNA polymerase sigma factor [Actinomadura logoneensis]